MQSPLKDILHNDPRQTAAKAHGKADSTFSKKELFTSQLSWDKIRGLKQSKVWQSFSSGGNKWLLRRKGDADSKSAWRCDCTARMEALLYRWTPWWKISLHVLDASWNIQQAQSHNSLSEERKSAEFLTTLDAANKVLYLDFTWQKIAYIVNTNRQQIIGCTSVCNSVFDYELLHSQAEACYLLNTMGIAWLQILTMCVLQESGTSWILLLIEMRQKHQLGGWSGTELLHVSNLDEEKQGLGAERRAPGKKTWSWKEERNPKAMKMLAGGKLMEFREDPKD